MNDKKVKPSELETLLIEKFDVSDLDRARKTYFEKISELFKRS